jgi:hypothetical protein
LRKPGRVTRRGAQVRQRNAAIWKIQTMFPGTTIEGREMTKAFGPKAGGNGDFPPTLKVRDHVGAVLDLVDAREIKTKVGNSMIFTSGKGTEFWATPTIKKQVLEGMKEGEFPARVRIAAKTTTDGQRTYYSLEDADGAEVTI